MASIAQPYNAAQFSWQNSQIPMASGPYQYAYGQAGYGQETSDYIGSFRDRDAQQVRYGAPDVGQFAQPMVGRTYQQAPNAVQPSIGSPSNATYSTDPITGRVTSTGNNIYANPYFGRPQQSGGAGVGRAQTAVASPQSANWRDAKRSQSTSGSNTNITPWTPGAARDPQLPPQQQQSAQNPYSIGQSIETPMPSAAESQYWVDQYAEQNARDFPNGATTRFVSGPAWGADASYNPDFAGQYGQSGNANSAAIAEGRASSDAWGNVDWQPQQQLQQQAEQDMMPYQNTGMPKTSGYVPPGQPSQYATKPAWRPGVGGSSIPVAGPGSPGGQANMVGPPLSGPRPQNSGLSISGMQTWPTPQATPQMIGPPLSGGQPYGQSGGRPVTVPKPNDMPPRGLNDQNLGFNGSPIFMGRGNPQPTQQSQQYGGGALTQGSWMNGMLSGLPQSGTYRTQTSTRMPTQRSISVRQQQFMY